MNTSFKKRFFPKNIKPISVSSVSYAFLLDMDKYINSGKIKPKHKYRVIIKSENVEFTNNVWKFGDSYVITIPLYFFHAKKLFPKTKYDITIIEEFEEVVAE